MLQPPWPPATDAEPAAAIPLPPHSATRSASDHAHSPPFESTASAWCLAHAMRTMVAERSARPAPTPPADRPPTRVVAQVLPVALASGSPPESAATANPMTESVDVTALTESVDEAAAPFPAGVAGSRNAVSAARYASTASVSSAADAS